MNTWEPTWVRNLRAVQPEISDDLTTQTWPVTAWQALHQVPDIDTVTDPDHRQLVYTIGDALIKWSVLRLEERYTNDQLNFLSGCILDPVRLRLCTPEHASTMVEQLLTSLDKTYLQDSCSGARTHVICRVAIAVLRAHDRGRIALSEDLYNTWHRRLTPSRARTV